MGQILYHTALLAPSLQDADPWSSVFLLPNKNSWTWDQWALDTGLSPGAPVNNCRWASTPLV